MPFFMTDMSITDYEKLNICLLGDQILPIKSRKVRLPNRPFRVYLIIQFR